MAGHFKSEVEVAKEDRERQHKYQVEEDVRALTKAEEIKKDSKRYGEAYEMMNIQKKMMESAMGKNSHKEDY